MIENTDIKCFKLVDFPEETDYQNGIKVYGETSLENQMAVLSLYLHDKKSHLDNGKKREIVNAIRDFLIRKKDIAPADITDDFIDRLAEAPAKYDLFSDFFNIPFPSPQRPKFTFIDLFAGIGGIRLGFEQAFNGNVECVFTSEIDKYAVQTYDCAHTVKDTV